MKVLVFVKATPESEKGLPPAADMQEMFRAMGEFNEKLVKAGVMKEADGLKPSSAGKRVKITDAGQVTVIDGPFVESKELVAGYWIWEVKSMDEALEWAKQCPNPMPGEDGVLEIRPTYSAEDFGDLLPADERDREARLRKQVDAQARRANRPAGKSKKSKKSVSKPAKKSKAARTSKRKPARAKAKK